MFNVADSAANQDFLLSSILGGSVVGALAFILLKGVMAQLKNYGSLVADYQSSNNNLNHQNNALSHENGVLNALIDDQRKTLIETQIHLQACVKDNEIANRRIEGMSAKILDLELNAVEMQSEINILKRQIHGQEKLD